MRVDGNRLLEKSGGLAGSVGRVESELIFSAVKQIIRFAVARAELRQLLTFGRREVAPDAFRNGRRNFRLKIRQAGDFRAILIAPDFGSVGAIHQLDVHPQPRADRGDASGDQGLHAERSGRFAHVEIRALEFEAGSARHHLQSRHGGERVDKALANAVGKIIGIRRTGRVHERNYGDGGRSSDAHKSKAGQESAARGEENYDCGDGRGDGPSFSRYGAGGPCNGSELGRLFQLARDFRHGDGTLGGVLHQASIDESLQGRRHPGARFRDTRRRLIQQVMKRPDHRVARERLLARGDFLQDAAE